MTLIFRIALLLCWWCWSWAAFGQQPSVDSLTNSLSGDARVAPGVWARITGRNFSTQSLYCCFTKEGISVLVNNRPAVLALVNPSEMQLVLPWETPAGPATLVVQSGGRSSAPFAFTLDAYAPALSFFYDGLGTNFGSFVAADEHTEINVLRLARPGEPLHIIASGLGQTNPPSTTGIFRNEFLPTAAAVTVTIAGRPATVISAGTPPGALRTEITFTVPPDLAPGSYPVSASVGGRTSNSVTLPIGEGGPFITAFQNGANYRSVGAAPGSILTIKAVGFNSIDRLGVYPATEAGGVSVFINGTPAPLFDVIGSANQINLLVPSELPTGDFADVIVQTPAAASYPAKLFIAPYTPGLFGLIDPQHPLRRNVAAGALWFAMPGSISRTLNLPDSCAGLSSSTYCGQPVRPNDYIEIYATGLGRATSGGDPAGAPLPTGGVAPADSSVLYLTVENPIVRIGNIPAEVLFSGLAPGSAGVYQINVRIPEKVPFGDDMPLELFAPCCSGSDKATIAIQK